jgi:hypothetical protein|nr:MAG TPA: hypothetical protein [Caudoviricetes sp.]
MFEDTVTVFNVIKEKDKVTYHRQFVNNVFYHKEKIISQEGKGDKYTNAYDVIFSNIALEKWKSKQDFDNSDDTYTLRENDIIVLNEYKEISDLKELQQSSVDWFMIKTVSENLYGDLVLHNIEVTN